MVILQNDEFLEKLCILCEERINELQQVVESLKGPMIYPVSAIRLEFAENLLKTNISIRNSIKKPH